MFLDLIGLVGPLVALYVATSNGLTSRSLRPTAVALLLCCLVVRKEVVAASDVRSYGAYFTKPLTPQYPTVYASSPQSTHGTVQNFFRSLFGISGQPEPAVDAPLASITEECSIRTSSFRTLLRRPFAVVDSRDLLLLRTAAIHSSELNRLVDFHQDSLLEIVGENEVNALRIRLQNSVERPLRLACSGLKHLNSSLQADGLSYNFRNETQRELVSRQLEEFRRHLFYQLQLIDDITRTYPPLLVHPSRYIQLQSERCARRNCFLINGQGIDDFSLALVFQIIRRTESAIGLVNSKAEMEACEIEDNLLKVGTDVGHALGKIASAPMLLLQYVRNGFVPIRATTRLVEQIQEGLRIVLAKLTAPASLPDSTSEWIRLVFIVGILSILAQLVASDGIARVAMTI